MQVQVKYQFSNVSVLIYIPRAFSPFKLYPQISHIYPISTMPQFKIKEKAQAVQLHISVLSQKKTQWCYVPLSCCFSLVEFCVTADKHGDLIKAQLLTEFLLETGRAILFDASLSFLQHLSTLHPLIIMQANRL